MERLDKVLSNLGYGSRKEIKQAIRKGLIEVNGELKNLEKANYKVDYFITHCCPTSIQTLLNPSYKKDILTDYLQERSEKCEFKKWYFGHYHEYKQVNTQFTLLYENIVPLEFNSIFE